MKACVLYHIIFCFFYFNAFDEEIFYLSRNFIFYCWNCSYVRNWTKKKKKKKKIESKQKFISFAKYSLLPYVHVFYRDFQTSKIHKHPQFNYATRTSSQLFFFSNIYLSILSLITKERKKLANSPSNIPRFRFAIDRSSRRSWSPLRLENLESEPRFTSTREETRGEKAGTLRGYRYNCHKRTKVEGWRRRWMYDGTSVLFKERDGGVAYWPRGAFSPAFFRISLSCTSAW